MSKKLTVDVGGTYKQICAGGLARPLTAEKQNQVIATREGLKNLLSQAAASKDQIDYTDCGRCPKKCTVAELEFPVAFEGPLQGMEPPNMQQTREARAEELVFES